MAELGKSRASLYLHMLCTHGTKKGPRDGPADQVFCLAGDRRASQTPVILALASGWRRDSLDSLQVVGSLVLSSGHCAALLGRGRSGWHGCWTLWVYEVEIWVLTGSLDEERVIN